MFKQNWLGLGIGILIVALAGWGLKSMMTGSVTQVEPEPQNPAKILAGSFDESKFKSEADWQKILTPSQFQILRRSGTEPAFSSPLDKEIRAGTYYSVGCDQPVFRSEQKYNSKTGWPSFWAPISKDALVLRVDDNLIIGQRTEVLDKCGGHLGHVFDDGPQPTGQRFCMNGLALKFVPDPVQPTPKP